MLRQTLALLGNSEEPAATATAETAEPLVHGREMVFGGLDAKALEGRYIGSYLGEVRVGCEGEGLKVTVGPPGNRQTGFGIVPEGDGFKIQSRMPVALRFCEAEGEPVLYLGVHAYKRVAAA